MPRFKTYNAHLLLPEENTCHKVRRIPRPDDWDDLPFFSERKDMIDQHSHIQIQDTVIFMAWDEGKLAYFEIKGLRG
jgi:hypothetical protein